MSILNTALWEFYAVGYDALLVSLPHKHMRQEVIKAIEKEPPLQVLDLGCGTGALVLDLAKKRPSDTILALDFSRVMLLIGRFKQALLGRKNVTFERHSLHKPLIQADQSQDVIITINTLFAVPDPQMVIDEMARVLKNHGQVITIVPKVDFSYGKLVKQHFVELKKLRLGEQIILGLEMLISIPFWIIIFVANFFITSLEKGGHYSTYDEKKLLTMMKLSGFAEVTVSETCAKQEWLVVAYKGKK